MLNKYHLQQSEKASRAVEEMLANPCSREESIVQVVRLFKSDMILSSEEEIIWSDANLIEHERVMKIKGRRVSFERKEWENTKNGIDYLIQFFCKFRSVYIPN
jgi:hypothetical protein